MKNKHKRKGFNAGDIRCPYCGSHAIFKSADGIYKDNSRGTMLYVCAHYPQCDAYVRAHAGTRIPVGSMANHELRQLRKTAHDCFDKLYKTGIMTKQEAYQWLADIICAPLSQAHIGYLGEYYCKVVIERSKQLLARSSMREKEKHYQPMKGGVIAS